MREIRKPVVSIPRCTQEFQNLCFHWNQEKARENRLYPFIDVPKK